MKRVNVIGQCTLYLKASEKKWQTVFKLKYFCCKMTAYLPRMKAVIKLVPI